MSLTLPLALTAVALLLAFSAYRGIRRGGARFYTLEREAILRRASFSLILSILLFIAAVGALLYEGRQATPLTPEENGQLTVTPDLSVEAFPPTETPTPTPDPHQPTLTSTPPLCRAVVEGTSGSGLTLREEPGGTEVIVLPEGEIVFLVAAEPVTSGGFIWRQIRTVGQREGWVVDAFLTITDECR